MTQFNLATHAMKTAAQMGSINRFCVKILSITRLEELIPLIASALDEFSVTGGYQVSLADSKISRCVGDRDAARHAMQRTRNLPGELQKIVRAVDLLFIRQSRFNLVVDTTNMLEHDVDLLVDNLAIFCDVIQNWALHTEEIFLQRMFTDHQKNRTVNRLEKFKECLDCSSFKMQECNERLNSDVITRLAMLFPVLGLEADQENRILELFEKCQDEFGDFVSKQVIFNGEISELLMKASSQLKPDNDYHI